MSSQLSFEATGHGHGRHRGHEPAEPYHSSISAAEPIALLLLSLALLVLLQAFLRSFLPLARGTDYQRKVNDKFVLAKDRG